MVGLSQPPEEVLEDRVRTRSMGVRKPVFFFWFFSNGFTRGQPLFQVARHLNKSDLVGIA